MTERGRKALMTTARVLVSPWFDAAYCWLITTISVYLISIPKPNAGVFGYALIGLYVMWNIWSIAELYGRMSVGRN